PGLRVTMVIGRSDALDEAVQQAELDIAVVPSYPGIILGCEQLAVGDDTTRVAVRADHPLTRRATLGLTDLVDHAWAMPSRRSAARRLVTQIFDQAGLPAPRVALETDYMSEAAMGLIAGTDLLGLVPAAVLRSWRGDVETLPLPMLDVRRTLVLLTRPYAKWSPLMTAFRDLMLAR
ncbi:MAG: LysR family transcriptional regulator, partial [Oxalobacteraceae bacterium]